MVKFFKEKMFVIFIFVICMNAYKGKNRDNFLYIRNCLVISVNLLYVCSVKACCTVFWVRQQLSVPR